MITSTHEELNRRTSATTGRGRHEKKRTTMKRRARGFHPLHRRHSSTSFSRRTRRAIASRFKQARKKDRKTETEEAVRYEANREREEKEREKNVRSSRRAPSFFERFGRDRCLPAPSTETTKHTSFLPLPSPHRTDSSFPFFFFLLRSSSRCNSPRLGSSRPSSQDVIMIGL